MEIPLLSHQRQESSHYILCSYLQSLTKFLKCVSWNDNLEVQQATALLSAWNTIGIDDALELLGSGFRNRQVRKYAITQLGRAHDSVKYGY